MQEEKVEGGTKIQRRQPPQQQQQSGPPQSMETREIRKEMRGPTIDNNLFAGTPLMSNYPKPPAPVTYYQPENPMDDDDRFSMTSSDSSLSSEESVKKVIYKGKKNKSGGFELNIK